VLLIAICSGIIGSVALLRSKRASTPNLLKRLPLDDAVVVYIDFAALRRARILDLLSGANVVQDPEYRLFVDQTGFDYTRDLDAALVSFHPAGTYFLLRGRFDWRTLKQYVRTLNGSCYNSLCKMEGSTPERKISYFPLQPDVMALAVAKSESAVLELQERRPAPDFEVPAEPVWFLVPVSELKNSGKLPPAARLLAESLTGVQRILFAFGANGDALELRADASCQDAAAAGSLAALLTDATGRLRQAIAAGKQPPDPREAIAVLSAGAFERKNTHVIGRWPIGRAFLETLAGGAN